MECFITILRRRHFVLVVVLLFSVLPASAQRSNTRNDEPPRAGIMVRPLFPSRLFDNNPYVAASNGNDIRITPLSGFSFGGIIRKNFDRNFYLESGINYTRRAYRSTYTDSTGIFNEKIDFKVISYEIPVHGGVYIRLSDRAYLANSYGLSADFFPNNLIFLRDTFRQSTKRHNWVLPALEARLSLDYRTPKAGVFSFGASYHRMLTYIGNNTYEFAKANGQLQRTGLRLHGHYFALELRYFLPVQGTRELFYDDLEPR